MANNCDAQYKTLIRDIIENGETRTDRTGTGTLSVFGRSMRFDIQTKFPLISSKKVYFKGVAEELLWIISGCTNAKALSNKGVHIWDANGSKEFLSNNGLPYKEGDLGPVYGHQWRHFNAKYKSCDDNYSKDGVDQLSDVIELIKKDPTSRRIILSAWNPVQNRQMALPPCHTLCQFYVNTTKKTLSCQLYQRSGDVGLGIPFNIASYALLTYMIAKVTGYSPGEFVHVIGDAHIYLNHVDALKSQLEQEEHESPTLELDEVLDIDNFTYDKIHLKNYVFSKAVSMKMAV